MDDERKELIRRSLDGELHGSDQQRLRQLAADDTQLAEELALQQLLQQDLQALAQVDDPGQALTDKIMAALPQDDPQPAPVMQPAPVIRRLRSMLAAIQRPVAMPAWGLALLLLGIGLALVYSISAMRAGDLPPNPQVARTEVPPQPAPQPEAPAQPKNKDLQLASVTPPPAACPATRVMMRFLLHAPKARQVALVGDFNDWAREGTPMADTDKDGIWSVTVPLTPGRYQYKFLLDGKRWMVEPDAAAYHPDGFGGRNSLLEI